MDTIEDTLYNVEQYNSLIKYQLKSNNNVFAGERKINLSIEGALPDFETFKTHVLQILDKGAYSNEFIFTINRLYSLSEANSDLIVEGNSLSRDFVQKLRQDYPIFPHLDKLSLDVFQFIHYNILRAKDEFEQPITYKGFESTITNLPEYYFKDNHYILWKPYHFISAITDAYTKQLLTDFNNRKKLILQNEIEKFTQQCRIEHINKVIELSTNFCDRNFVSDYLLEKPSIDKTHIIGYILSDMLEKLNLSDYARYIEFNYTKYSPVYDWKFEKNSINDYTDLTALPQFEHLILLLSSILFVRELDTEEKPIIDTQNEISPEFNSEKIPVSTTIDVPLENKEIKNYQSVDNEIEIEPNNPINKEKSPLDCITKISTLMQVHEEFNDVLWENISELEFLNVFATNIQKVETFELKDKTQFYYLLKRIWRNRTDTSTFKYEKEWLIPFLDTYGLSHSSYSNQFIEKEGAYNHRRFIKAVADIFPE